MSGIRVTYSGLIAFTIALISVITGIVFTLIVTRRLSPEEFGIWAIIGSMISYFLVVEPIISYWSTRQIARGEDVGKTSLTSSIAFSFGSVPIYLILAYFVSSVSVENTNSLILGVILLPVTFISQTLKGINLGHKPHAISYGILVFELVKIPSGLLLVYFLNLGIDGAIIATLIAFLCQICIQTYFALPKLRNTFKIIILRRWIKLSWVSLYSYLGHLLWTLDVLVYSLIVGSVVGVAFFVVSNAIAAIIANAGMISQGLYPKLLARGSHEYFRENFIRLTYFAIPLLGIALLFSKPALFTLNPAYIDASPIVIFLSFRTFFFILTATFYKVLLGIETVDVDNNAKFSNFVKSKLFLVPTLKNIHYGLYVVITAIVLLLLRDSSLSEMELVTWWSIVALSIQIPFFVIAILLTRKSVKFPFPFKNVIKYIIGTAAFILIYFVTADFLIEYHESIYDFLPGLLVQIAICIGVYLGVTLLIDKKTRDLLKSIINEFSSNK